MQSTKANALETEHVKWLQNIHLFKSQLAAMQAELENFAKGKYPKSVAPKIEQFQNKFIRHREVLDTLRHDIKAHENEIERMTNFALEYLRDRLSREHVKLKAEYNKFVELFIELEQDFNDLIE
jgi:septal ring factor EnvC (AmiA/AmiB activator)